MEKPQPSPGSGSSSRSSSRATSAGSSPSSSGGGGGRRVSGASRLQAVAGRLNGGSLGTGDVIPGAGGSGPGAKEQVLEGVLSKYTNLLQGWQNRYFLLDYESGVLQYFVTEASKTQKPRGSLTLAGSLISLGDEVPNMLVVSSANGEMYKLRAADAKERQFWLTQLQACAKFHTENAKSSTSARTRSFSLLPHGTPISASPGSQRHQAPIGPSVVTITHHKSPAAARRAKSQYPDRLQQVKEKTCILL